MYSITQPLQVATLKGVHVKLHLMKYIILQLRCMPHLSNKAMKTVNGSAHPHKPMQNELLPLPHGPHVHHGGAKQGQQPVGWGGWGGGVWEPEGWSNQSLAPNQLEV